MSDSDRSLTEPEAHPAAGRPGRSVCAVAVTYHPDPDTVRALIDAIAPQVDAVVVVDNATPGLDLTGVVLLRQQTNLGLARAQNIGIEWAREHGHSHVVLFDQDSVPDPGMVENLLAAYEALSSTVSGTRQVGAVGPRFRDPRTGRDAPFVKVAFPMSQKLWCEAGTPHIECDFLISSGVLIPLAVLDDVGGMDDGLFIDNVDMEWSFRARSRGYALFGVCSASMEHRLGDARRPVLLGRVTVVTHGPVRLYFIMRNRVALYRLHHTPRVWIAQDLPRVLAKFLIFSVLVGPRPRNVRYMLRGLADGLRGRSGPCSVKGSG